MCVLFAEVNLRDMGLSRMSLRMFLLRRGGAPPRHRVRSEALTCQQPPPMWMGCVVMILFAASRDDMRLGSIALGEKRMLMVVPVYPWSEMIRWELLGWLGL